MAHALIAIALQAAIGLATGNWLLGGLIAVGIFVGREQAQAEYRWIERYGLGRRANMPWHGGFQPRVWSVKSLLDIAAPALAVALIGGLA